MRRRARTRAASGRCRRDRRPQRRAGRRADGGRQQPLLDLRVEHGLAGGGQDGPADLGPGGVLGQVAERACLQGADDRLVVGVGEISADVAGAGHAVSAR